MYPRSAEVIVVSWFLLCLGEPTLSKNSGNTFVFPKGRFERSQLDSIMLFLQMVLTLINFIYSEKATKFCEILTLLLSSVVPVKSKVKISQNFVAFSEYMNFI